MAQSASVLIACKQQIGGCPDPMVSEEMRLGEMKLANMMQQTGEKSEVNEVKIQLTET